MFKQDTSSLQYSISKPQSYKEESMLQPSENINSKIPILIFRISVASYTFQPAKPTVYLLS